MTGLFAEVAKALITDADKAFSGGLLGRAAQNLLKAPATPHTGDPAARTGDKPKPFAHAGDNVFRPSGLAAGQERPVPILKQILGVLETVAAKIGLLPRFAAGAPTRLREQLSGLGSRIFTNPLATATAQQQGGGTAKHHFQQIAHQLAGKPFFKTFVPPAKIPAGAGAAGAGIGRALMALGRFAGVAGLVVAGLSVVGNALKSFVTSVQDSNLELAKWNGQLATSFTQLQVTKMNLDVQQAGAIAGSGSALNEQIGQLMTELQPIRNSVGSILNLAAAGIVGLSRIYIEVAKFGGVWKVLFPGIAAIADAAKVAEDWMNKNKPKNGDLPLNAALRDLRGLDPLRVQKPGGVVQPLQPPGFLPPLVRPKGVR